MKRALEPWRTLARRVVYAARPWLEVAVEKVALPNGQVVDDFIQLRSRDFVMVVAFTDDGRIVTARSYKHGPRRVSISFPAGFIEDAEQPEQAARRELLEETGYEASSWTALGAFVSDGNYGLNTEHVFVARGAHRVREPASGDLEEIEVGLHSRDEIVAAIREGEVVQLSAAAAFGLAIALEER